MGILALIVFIAVTIVLNTVLKREISESLVVALVATALLGGAQAPQLLGNALLEALQSEVTFAGMAFVFMGIIVTSTGLIDKLIEILNSIFGKLPGGAAYVSTLGSAIIGLMAGSTAGNSATVGSVTIPWMKKAGWSSERAATLVAGNSGLGVALPPNSTMFIILALPVAAGASSSGVYVALACGGAYAVLYRLAVVYLWTKTDKIKATPADHLRPLSHTLRAGWSSPSIFIGIIAPVLITIGPLAGYLATHMGEDAIKAISIIVWVPVLITIIALIEGALQVFRHRAQFIANIRSETNQFATVGISLFAALAAAKIMEELGVGDQLSGLLNSMDLPRWIMLFAVGILAVLVATPLSSTATAAAIGAPAVAALTSVGLDPTLAIVVILLCTSTEGASPPVGAPIYLSAAMAEADPPKMFVPLVVYFVVPMILLAWLIGMGWLPILLPS